MKIVDKNLKKAVIELLILKLLYESDKYGYQITQEFKKRSNDLYTILEGSMYPILYRLLEQGVISSYEKKVGVRQTRIYYHIEESGIQRYNELKASYYSSIKIINFLLESTEGDCYSPVTHH